MDVLTVTFDAGGNVPPFLGLGQELRRRGHGTRCLGPRSIQAAVERAGMGFWPLEHGAVFDPLARQPADKVRIALLRVFLDDGYGRDLRAELKRARPDVTVVDCLLVEAQPAAEALGRPYALLLHTLPRHLKD
jgi:UDP:flavonoid glycosyltransferase YjiC (YdhE family)